MLIALLISPWAIGGVDAWAIYALDIAIMLAAALSFWSCRGQNRFQYFLSLPSIALLGLTLLCLFQAHEWPESVLRVLDSRTTAFLDGMIPDLTETVQGDQPPPVASSSRTLSADPEATRHQATRFFMAWILFQAVMGLGSNSGGSGRYKRLAIGLIINASFLTIFAIVQALNWNGKIYWVREIARREAWTSAGPFVNHGHFADYLNLALGLGLGMLFAKNEWGDWNWRRGGKLWLLYLCGLLIVGVASSQSRAGAVAMAVCAIVFLSLIRPPLKLMLGGIGGAAILGLVFLNVLGPEATVERLQTLGGGDTRDREVAWRSALWLQGYGAWANHPWFGVGLGAFQVGMAPEMSRDLNYYFDHAENEYLTILVESGAVGMTLCLLGIGGVFWAIRQAARQTSRFSRKALILGASFSILAISLHNFTDFSTEIPAVSMTAVTICGYVCGMSLRRRHYSTASGSSSEEEAFDEIAVSPDALPTDDKRSRTISTLILALSWIAGAILILPHDYNRHRAAWLVIGADLPRPATRKATTPTRESNIVLNYKQKALEEALFYRPNWYEGHMRLALNHLSRYGNAAYDALKNRQIDKEIKEVISTPIWLRHSLIEAKTQNVAIDLSEDVPDIESLRQAARSLLEARRCCPGYAPAHVWLGCLDFLLERESRPERGVTIHAKRAFQAVGSDDEIVWMIAELAAMDNDDDFLADCWRRSLQVHEKNWEKVADASENRLSPEFVLEKIAVQGRHALWFADRLYAEKPDKEQTYRTYLEAAIERLPIDSDLDLSEKLYYEGLARAKLGEDPEMAYPLLEQSLQKNPRSPEWRLETVKWLLRWNMIEEAKRQALLATGFHPNHASSLQARKLVSEAEVNALINKNHDPNR